ncbi:uncharacterized protein Z518_08922 [Rhinocladiella mackenziei CBS 650.93]|uniref:MaoC-like domain-containing protein n=1 Tax=Rhinocladiella mackenziei CBS 650.93 TaxID=1442369 RepID=A0A0D2FGQ8_9EURO|nr:uncharacterized protein Z518_08922 [Rhinocladiella mackenziei CBS 650.93]KIX01197.1 hypothetical protein Z518_08922 [Rhinocladiella mackenziei CBS 650.93]
MPSLYRYPSQAVTWNDRDVVYFALSIGCTADELHYLYENHPNFAAFPTYPIVLTFKHDHVSMVPWREHFTTHFLPPPGQLVGYPTFPALDITRVVDGERTLDVLRPIPTSSQGRNFEVRSEVVAVWDKGKGRSTVLKTEHLIVEILESGDEVEFTRMSDTAVFMGQGGWGGPNGKFTPSHPYYEAYDIMKITLIMGFDCDEQDSLSPSLPPPPAETATTVTTTHQIPATAHLLYRLNGDYNPLHATYVESAMVQPTPILHGLYSWNGVSRAVLNVFAHGDPTALTSFRARFTSPVWPGDVLETKMWVLDEYEDEEAMVVADVRFVTSVRDKIVLADGRALLRLGKGKGKSKSKL